MTRRTARRPLVDPWRLLLPTALALSGCGAAEPVTTTGGRAAGAPGGVAAATTPSSAPASSAPRVASARLPAAGPPCPAPERRGLGLPPWELRHRFDRCVRGPEGRWYAERDPSDPEGDRFELRFDGARGEVRRLEVVAPRALARRTDGGLAVVDAKQGITLVSPRGEVLGRTTHPACGHVEAVAVGLDHTITIACGYSVLRLDAHGALVWQVWPFGNVHVGGVTVDRDGVAYVSGDGKVAALGADGRAVWTTSTGFNRAVGRLVWNAADHLVFDTSMDALHSDPETSGGYRFYYDPEPNELFELDRRGRVVRRAVHEGGPPPGGWPEVLPVDEDGAHRGP